MKPSKPSCYCIGLTGTIAAGKSTVLSYLKTDYGARCLDCDLIAREIVDESRLEIAALFGAGVLSDTGIDRKALSAIVFADAQALSRLNALIHPKVYAYVENEIRSLSSGTGGGIVVIEAIGLLTTPLKDLCDSIWVVSASPEIRLERMLKTRGMTVQEAQARMNSQWDDQTFRTYADVVIDTSSDDFSAMHLQVDQALAHFPGTAFLSAIETAPSETDSL